MYGDWAEETLLQAERALRALGSPKPEWLDADYYHKKIANVLDGDTTEASMKVTLSLYRYVHRCIDLYILRPSFGYGVWLYIVLYKNEIAQGP